MYANREHGFTLVEVIITAAFVATASAAIISTFITISRLNKESRNMATVTALAEQKLETYRDAGYTAVPTGTPAEDFTSSLPKNLGAPKSAVANVSVPQDGLKQVDILISYKDDNITKNVRLSTVVAQRGIDR